MKKGIFLIITAGVLLASCGGNADNAAADGAATTETEEVAEAPAEDDATLAGTWQLSDIDMGMEIPAGQEEMFNRVLQDMKDNTSYVFNEDGTYTSKSKIGNDIMEQSGSWTMEDGQLNTTSKDGKAESLMVKEMTSTTVTFQKEMDGQTMTMTFTKS